MSHDAHDTDRVANPPDGDGPADEISPRFSAFLRGVTIGALVGAAIAGSALWERAIRRRAMASGEEAAQASGQDAAEDDAAAS